MNGKNHYRVAVDVGGTFMDFVLVDEDTGQIRIEKVPSLPQELANQFVAGLRNFEINIKDIRQIFHGMTVGVNALVQARGAKVGLLTTAGFRDVLEMGRGGRKPVYNFTQRSIPPIIERLLRREITERVTHLGEVLKPLDLAEVDREVDFLVAQGCDAIGIAFLHAYAFEGHEAATKARIQERYPDLEISVSHEIAAEWREYERTSTTVLNAFIQPTVKGYLKQLGATLNAAGYAKPIAVMQSSGGVVDATTAGLKPIRTLMSGPAGGVIGAKYLADRLGHANVICTDVGGTTYDVAIIEEGRILERSQFEIGGRPILGSMIDVISIGAGGGSIAWLDHRNGLQVGPRSAGASPGPVCFGKGGTEPTVTDAHLVLGRLDPKYFLGGRMALDVAGAKAALTEKICNPLGIGLSEAAQGIVSIAETNMANAIRTKTVERGLDPREFVLMAFGGGGGLFACSVAKELGIPRVIVPVAPANFSAWGILTSDYSEDEVRTRVTQFDGRQINEMIAIADELMEKAVASIVGYGFARDTVEQLRRFDMRFLNQEYTLEVPLDASWTTAEEILARARDAFVEAHQRLYGHGDKDAELEVVAVRCRAVGRVQPLPLSHPTVSAASSEESRDVHFPDLLEPVRTSIVDRSSLSPGQVVAGPVIINEWTMTTIVPPDWAAMLDQYGNLILTPNTTGVA